MIGGLFTVAAIVMLVSTAGGGGWLVAGGPLQGHAEAPATVNPDTAAEHGFAEPTVEEVEIQETITAGGVEKRVNVTGYVAATGTQDGAVQVLLLTLPGWDVAGVTANPLAYVPLKQAVRHVLPQLPMETPEVTWEGESSMELGGQTVTAGVRRGGTGDAARRRPPNYRGRPGVCRRGVRCRPTGFPGPYRGVVRRSHHD